MFCYVWEFTVRPEQVGAFLEAYGPQGTWASLFRRDPAYVRTDLHRDVEQPHRFLTVDHWTSREACEAFRDRFRLEYDAIDRRCEAFTTQERCLGQFDTLA